MGVVDEVFEFLEDEGVSGGATGWKTFRRRIPDEGPGSDQCIAIAEDGGTQPEMSAQSGMGDSAMADTGVFITVRAEAWDGDASFAKAQEIWSALHGLRDVVLGGSGSATYFRVRALTSEPVFAGYDDQGRPRHTIGFRFLKLV